MLIRALTLDLDDTLWPVRPAIDRADHAVDTWLRQHYPSIALAWPVHAIRDLRERVAVEHPELAHDFTKQRLLTMQHLFETSGVANAPLNALWEVFFAARNSVELYPDSLPALQRISARYPLASLTNGNADVDRIGIQMHFAHRISAREFGAAKPDPSIFLAAAEQLDVSPGHILHVGDDPVADVCGARDAGLHTAWINRSRQPWPTSFGPAPDLDLPDMEALADWLDASSHDS